MDLIDCGNTKRTLKRTLDISRRRGVVNGFFHNALVFILAATVSHGLAAQTTDNKKDKKPPVDGPAFQKIKTDAWFDYRLGLEGFFNTEFPDSQANGAADQSGSGREDTGFNVERAFFRVEAIANENAGPMEDWRFKLTVDSARAGSTGEGCGIDNICGARNDYIVNIREAFVQVPLKFLPGRSFLRYGVHDNAMVFGAAGYHLAATWTRRYVERTHIQESGILSPYERGLSFIWKGDYAGAHVALTNGGSSGSQQNNAEGLVVNSLDTLAMGQQDSYGLDFTGILHVKPTGKRKDFQWYIGLPYRFQNVVGMQGDEFEFLSADLTSATAEQFAYFRGDSRAKQDASYGLASDLIYRKGILQLNLGFGAMRVLDRRGNAFQINQTNILTGLNESNFNASVRLGEDSVGWSRYVWAAARYGYFEIYGRLIVQTQVDTISRIMQVPSGQSWLTQALVVDSQDGVLGNLTLNRARVGIDEGLGRLRNVIYGITFYPLVNSDRFRISLGVTELYGTQADGTRFRDNPLSRYTGSEFGVATSLDNQIASRTDIASQLLVPAGETLVLNDYIGRNAVQRETYIRAIFILK